jgi:hypothetical protein
MGIADLSNVVVRTALEAINTRQREVWLGLFAPDAMLTDDGTPHDYVEWADAELFGVASGGQVTAITRVEDDGQTVYTDFHSNQWGDFRGVWKFQIQAGKITRLDVEQA